MHDGVCQPVVLQALWAGPLRVRVRESDLESFVAESAIRRERLEEGDPWVKVGEAAKAVASAVGGQDREALDRAIARLADAAREPPSGEESTLT